METHEREEYREIQTRAANLSNAASLLIQPDRVDEDRPRKPEPSRGHAAITAAILSVEARIEALTYVLQRLEDPYQDREKDRNS